MIEEIDYPTILNFWQNYLWSNRKNITPMSTMRYKDNAYNGILKNYQPSFFGYVVDNNIVGVNSGHASSKIHYRSRGLYVLPEYRYNNIGQKLLQYTLELAAKENKVYCWSLPRKTALKTYINAGFIQTSDFFETETSEFNCYVIKKI